MTAAALRRGLPMWAVAVASGLVALMFVGIIYAILASTSSPPKTVTSATPSGSASAGGGAPGAAAPIVVPGTGPFSAARAAFAQTITPPPKPTTQLAPSAPPATVAPAQTASAPAQTATASTPAANTAANTVAAANTGGARPTPTPTPTPTPRVEKETTGFLTIICKPACDQVFDNGRALGASPIFRATVPVGEHRLQLKTNSPPVNKVLTVYVVRDDLKYVPVTMTP